MMKQTYTLDDYRHKLVDKIIHANSLEEVKRYLLTALGSLNKHDVNEHLVSRFIDKSINQLNGLTLLNVDIKTKLNARYGKAQLEIIKRHKEEQAAKHV
jgi:hypothetical protein